MVLPNKNTSMNESNPTPPPVPPATPDSYLPADPLPGRDQPPVFTRSIPSAPVNPPPGTDPAEREPIPHLIASIEAMLRQPRRVMFQLRQPGAGRLIAALLVLAAVFALIYGLVVGTFSGGDQYWAAPVKIAGGLFISAAICLPSLYIFSCLGGSQARLVEVLGLMAGFLVLMTVLLIGFAPVAWVFSQSTQSEVAMGALHLIFWVVATWFGLRFLSTGLGHLGGRSGGWSVWVLIFLFVALQMTTALRPIVGRAKTFLPPPTEKKFFVGHWMDCFEATNAPPRLPSETKTNDTRALPQ